MRYVNLRLDQLKRVGLTLCLVAYWALLHVMSESTPSNRKLHLSAANITVEAKRCSPVTSPETRRAADSFKHRRLFTTPCCQMLADRRQEFVLDGVPPRVLLLQQLYGEGRESWF